MAKNVDLSTLLQEIAKNQADQPSTSLNINQVLRDLVDSSNSKTVEKPRALPKTTEYDPLHPEIEPDNNEESTIIPDSPAEETTVEEVDHNSIHKVN